MPSVSKKQQRFMGIVRAYQKGTLKTPPTLEVQRAASSMKKKDVKKFASTKHKGLPEKKVTKESFNEDYVKELEDGLVKMDYPTYDEVDELMKKIAKENDIDTTTLHMAFKTKHLMVPDDWAKKKMMEPVMIPKTPQITGDVKEGVTPKQRFKRDAGKIAKAVMNQKEHEKYVNFLPVGEAVNAAQQAAIAISKKQRLMDLMVAKKKKKKLKEEQNPEGMKLSDVKKRQRQEQLKKASKKVPVVTNKIVPLHKESSYAEFEKRSGVKAVKPKKETELPKTPKKEPANTYASGNPVGKANVKRKLLNVSPGSKREVASRGILGKIKHVLTGEEVIYEYDGNYHMNKIAKEKKLDLTDPRQRRRANSLARHNAAKGNVNNPAGFSKRKKRKKMQTEGNLHNWFKGSKSKDGKGGWVNVVTGGTCASDKPGEGTPKCVSSSKRASMTKAERLSAQRRKKKADPNQQSKTGAAKPTYVKTDSPKKKKKVNESAELKKAKINFNTSKKDGKTIYKVNKNDEADAQKAMKNDPKYISGKTRVQAHQEAYGGKGVSRKAKLMSTHPPTAQAAIKNIPTETDRGAGNKAKRRSGQKVEKKSPSYKAYINNKEEYINEAGARIGKKYKRDEYGDPIKPDGSSALKKNVDKNPKDDKTPNNLVGEAKVTTNYNRNVSLPIGNRGATPSETSAIMQNVNDKKASQTGVVTGSDHPDKTKPKKVEPQPIKRVKRQVMQDSYIPVIEAKSPAWQRKAGKSESGGLNAKGVASYRAANPGSKLKTAVTTKPSKLKKGSKSSKRRLSFCRRMKGMKKKLTSAKTARDPDSRINKSLRKWNCSFEPETGEMIMERGPQVLGSGARQKSIHAKKGKKGTKKVSGMIISLKRKGSILKQPLGGPADAAAKARRLSYVKDDTDLTILRFIDEGHMNKTCGKGEYYCYNDKKCKSIPKGMRIGYGGMLKPENEKDESNGKKGGSNGNGNGHGGNGNGNGGNGNGGNGGGNGGGE